LETAALASDDDTSKNLDTCLVTFRNLEVDANAIADFKVCAVARKLIFSDVF
jgi:hypothetical protein